MACHEATPVSSRLPTVPTLGADASPVQECLDSDIRSPLATARLALGSLTPRKRFSDAGAVILAPCVRRCTATRPSDARAGTTTSNPGRRYARPSAAIHALLAGRRARRRPSAVSGSTISAPSGAGGCAPRGVEIASVSQWSTTPRPMRARRALPAWRRLHGGLDRQPSLRRRRDRPRRTARTLSVTGARGIHPAQLEDAMATACCAVRVRT